MNSHEVFIHIHQGCFAGTGAIIRLPQCQWSKPDGYGKISQCITTTKHSKAKTVCIFLGIYCSNQFLYLTQSQHQLRGHSRKLEKKYCWKNLWQNYFSHRVVNNWNCLPEDVISEPSLPCFKRRLRSLPVGEEGWPIQVSIPSMTECYDFRIFIINLSSFILSTIG